MKQAEETVEDLATNITNELLTRFNPSQQYELLESVKSKLLSHYKHCHDEMAEAVKSLSESIRIINGESPIVENNTAKYTNY